MCRRVGGFIYKLFVGHLCTPLASITCIFDIILKKLKICICVFVHEILANEGGNNTEIHGNNKELKGMRTRNKCNI